MPANTARLALPYPLPDDSVDVPRDVQALAAKLDALTSVAPRVTALPASPVEGQEVAFFNTQSATNALWHLRYMADLGKWAFLGGAPWGYVVGNREVPGTGNVWMDLTTPGPSFTFPLAGDYDVEAFASADGLPASGFGWGVGMRYGAAAVNSWDTALFYAGGQSGSVQITIRHRNIAAVTAGTVGKVQYWNASVAAGFSNRYLFVTPRFVS